MSLTAAIKAVVQQQARKEAISRPRPRLNNLNIVTHDQALELVIGGGSDDISYCVVSTSLDYTSPL